MILPDVTLTALEYESLLLFAVRYALPGRTYGPGFVARQLVRSAGSLTNAGLATIADAIGQRVAEPLYGRTHEHETAWRRALDAVQAERARREAASANGRARRAATT